MSLIERPLSTYAEASYRDYALYVLLDRALARYSDGLKPVQRRILYAMHELHLGPNAKPKKSVRAIGDTLGKYHPHSDQAGYEALVGLVQNFSTRYPFVHGQGNFGSVDDPKSFAAMRYTEVRLSRYSPLLFDELSAESVQWVPNFDGSLKEPTELPAQLPVLLLNGCSGIAVGLSTEIPPHNLQEVIDALLAFIKNPQIKLEKLLSILPGPDFPLGGIIEMTPAEQLGFYQDGKGAFTLKAQFQFEENKLIISSIPYMTNTTKIIEQIHLLAQEKGQFPNYDLFDESDEDHPVRVVLHFKSFSQAKIAAEILYEKTDCSLVYRCYFHALDQRGLPYCFSLKEFFAQWLEYRLASVLAQAQARYLVCDHRCEVLKVYHLAFHHLDLIFKALQHEDDPWAVLKQKLNLTDQAVTTLSSLKLKDLSKLSIAQINQERSELEKEMHLLGQRIEHREVRLKFIMDQLQHLKKSYADKRRSEIVFKDPVLISEKKKANKELKIQTDEPAKKVSVIFTALGWIKVTKHTEESLAEQDLKNHLRQGDSLAQILHMTDQDTLIVFDAAGRKYGLSVAKLPTSKFGSHISEYLSLPSGALGLFLVPAVSQYILVTNQGLVLYYDSQHNLPQKRGKQIMTLEEGQSLSAVLAIFDEEYLKISTQYHEHGLIPLKDLTPKQSGAGLQMGRSAHPDALYNLTLLKNLESYSIRDQKNKAVHYEKDFFVIKRSQKLKLLPKQQQFYIHTV